MAGGSAALVSCPYTSADLSEQVQASIKRKVIYNPSKTKLNNLDSRAFNSRFRLQASVFEYLFRLVSCAE